MLSLYSDKQKAFHQIEAIGGHCQDVCHDAARIIFIFICLGTLELQ